MLPASPPFGVAPGEDVQVLRHLEQRPGDVRVADVVLALVGVDVAVALAGVRRESLIGIAMSAFDGYVPDVHVVAHAGFLRGWPVGGPFGINIIMDGPPFANPPDAMRWTRFALRHLLLSLTVLAALAALSTAPVRAQQ